jgi:hypothetical protein
MAGSGRSARLSVDVVANTRQAQDEIQGFSGKVAGAFAGVTAAATSFAIDKVVQGATAAAGQLVDAVGNAAELNAALATTQQIYGAATDQVTAWAREAAKSLGLSQTQALKTARTFSVYGKQIGLTGDGLAQFSRDITQTAADLGAFNDIPTAEAVEMIGSAFRGERDPIERLGIVLNDATVKAAYFAATGEKVTGVLTPQQNIIGTLAALNQQAADATGQYARESEGLAGQSQQLSATWENMSASLGQLLLPAVTAVAGWLNDSLLPALQDLGEWWNTSPVAAKIRDLADAIADKFQKAADDISTWWNEPDGGKETFDSFVQGMESLAPRVKSVYDNLVLLKAQVDQLFSSFGGLGGFLKTEFEQTLLRIQLITYFVVSSFQAAIIGIRLVVFEIQLIVAAVQWLWDKVQQLPSKLSEAAGWLAPLIPIVSSGLGRSAPAGAGTIAGRGLFGGTGRSGPAVVVNYHVPVTVPMGVHAGDVGGAIVAALEGWSSRNGPLPPAVAGALRGV